MKYFEGQGSFQSVVTIRNHHQMKEFPRGGYFGARSRHFHPNIYKIISSHIIQSFSD